VRAAKLARALGTTLSAMLAEVHRRFTAVVADQRSDPKACRSATRPGMSRAALF